MSKIFKWLYAFIFVIILVAAGFTFVVNEGSVAIVTRFGRIVNVHTDAGLFFKLPWPIDNVITLDARNQYMDSGYNETMTGDMINVILQSYLVWRIGDGPRFYTTVGDFTAAQRHLNNLIANTKNSVLGNYKLSSLVSTNAEEIRLDEIAYAIEEIVNQTAMNSFGIEVRRLRIKRIALPDANIQSVFGQMIADRQRIVSQHLAEGERDAAIIISEAEALAAEIIAAGRLEASGIFAETERMIAEIYGEAYNRNAELFVFLRNLIALENAVNPDTVLIMRANESPFGIINRAE